MHEIKQWRADGAIVRRGSKAAHEVAVVVYVAVSSEPSPETIEDVGREVAAKLERAEQGRSTGKGEYTTVGPVQSGTFRDYDGV